MEFGGGGFLLCDLGSESSCNTNSGEPDKAGVHTQILLINNTYL